MQWEWTSNLNAPQAKDNLRAVGPAGRSSSMRSQGQKRLFVFTENPRPRAATPPVTCPEEVTERGPA